MHIRIVTAHHGQHTASLANLLSKLRQLIRGINTIGLLCGFSLLAHTAPTQAQNDPQGPIPVQPIPPYKNPALTSVSDTLSLKLSTSFNHTVERNATSHVKKEVLKLIGQELPISLQLDVTPASPELLIPVPQQPPAETPAPLWIQILKVCFGLITLLIFIYSLRHYMFTLSRLFGRQTKMYMDINHAQWPRVTILVAAHNEERVIADSLAALMDVDYPTDRMTVIPVNDRSTDDTERIINTFVEQYPGRIQPFHRKEGAAGKSAALKDAMAFVKDDIFLVFDADYLPGKGLIKQLVAPFFDPEVGACMGRVVPINPHVNLLTSLLDLERTGGYQVDQQARANLNLTTQYGGTVGGVRKKALEQIGGWSENHLAEDTDITFRLRNAGWTVVYQNRAECYEEVPEEWAVRIKQLRRWAKGHHQVLLSQWYGLIRAKHLRPLQKLDGLMLLGIFSMSPLILIGWVLSLLLFYAGHGLLSTTGWLLLGFVVFSSSGNFAAFFQIACAAFLDGRRSRLALLPLGLVNFIVSSFEISRATGSQTISTLRGRTVNWEKTKRYRSMRVIA